MNDETDAAVLDEWRTAKQHMLETQA